MIKYELQEQEDCLVILAEEDGFGWLVELGFDKNEKEYAEAFRRILNIETNKAQKSQRFKMKKAYYDSTGKYFDFE
ncbi:hypothetical protein P4284_22775 [Bacillus swezeyi]|uniref:hypothetical protein n=1 Tax=Bacillus swezeyi TaxID=1925020 RepID=UPI002E208D41|nr:hypothetical protein [Bacillus swezeyi]MED2979488.1 hypothetical protein [Bacillus swezeyi]